MCTIGANAKLLWKVKSRSISAGLHPTLHNGANGACQKSEIQSLRLPPFMFDFLSQDLDFTRRDIGYIFDCSFTLDDDCGFLQQFGLVR